MKPLLEAKTMKALRVLVLEDNVIIGQLLAEMLETMGYDVCAIAATEADAVTAAGLYKPDLMIVDVQLDIGCGVAAVEKILHAGPVPHLFISGNISGVKMRRPGAVVIQKPFHEADLARAIKSVLPPAQKLSNPAP